MSDSRGQLVSLQQTRALRSMRTRRTARRRSRARSGSGITMQIAPMIDVTFLLLIFFLVTTTFERAEGLLASKLPRDSGAESVALPISPIIVRLTPTGLSDEGVSISIEQIDAEPADFNELSITLRRLQQQEGFDDETPVVLIAEDVVRWDHVVNAWNAALRAGCKRIAFAEPDGGS